MSPMLDEQFQEYRRLFEIVGNPIEEDFAQGSFCWRAWSILDFSQRAAAIDSLETRRLAGVQVLHSAQKPKSHEPAARLVRPKFVRIAWCVLDSNSEVQAEVASGGVGATAVTRPRVVTLKAAAHDVLRAAFQNH